MADKVIQLQSADGIDNLLPKSPLICPDVTNILAQGTLTYTATDYCMALTQSATNTSQYVCTLNGVQLCNNGTYSSPQDHFFIPMKNGDVLTINSGTNAQIKFVFGLK